jgi:hypothetical protein
VVRGAQGRNGVVDTPSSSRDLPRGLCYVEERESKLKLHAHEISLGTLGFEYGVVGLPGGYGRRVPHALQVTRKGRWPIELIAKRARQVCATPSFAPRKRRNPVRLRLTPAGIN